MNNFTFLLAVLFIFNFSTFQLQAQFTDGMEYPNGIPTSSTWWDCTFSCPDIISFYAHTGQYSGNIDGSIVEYGTLDLGTKTSGEWGLAFYMRIPVDKGAFWILLGDVPHTAEDYIGNIYFNQDGLAPGVGFVTDSALGGVSFNYPEDEWFRVVINVDITNGIALATWQMGVNGVEVVPAGTAFTNSGGDIPTGLGGVDFFSVDSNNELYIDDFEYVNGVLDLFLNVDENELLKFSVSPNPASENLNITTQSAIVGSKIYSLQGSLVFEGAADSRIDVSQLTSGVYFIELATDAGKSVQKFIKN